MAKEMMFSGREVLADEALRIGLANRILPLERIHDEAHALAVQIASHPRGVVRWVKSMIDQGIEMSVADGLALEIATNPGRNPDLEARLAKGGF